MDFAVSAVNKRNRNDRHILGLVLEPKKLWNMKEKVIAIVAPEMFFKGFQRDFGKQKLEKEPRLSRPQHC